MTTFWRVYQNDTVAAKLDRGELPGFFSKKVVVGLNEGAIVLRDGKPKEIFTESKVQAANILDQLGSLFGTGADISVYFVDLAPFELTVFLGEESTYASIAAQAGRSKAGEATQSRTSANSSSTRRIDQVGWLEKEGQEERAVFDGTKLSVSQVNVIALSADREVISASCHFRLRVDIDKPENFIGLLKGKRALATWDIAALIKDEFIARVLVPEIARLESSSLRGNRGLLTTVEEQTRSALSVTLSTFGLLLDSFSINWGLTEQERVEIAQKRGEREEQAREFSKNRNIAQMLRLNEIEKTRISNLQELKLAQAAGNEDLKSLLLSSEIKRNLLIKNYKVDAAEVDARIREISLKVEKTESQARLEQKRAAEELRLELEDKKFKQDHAARLASMEADDKEMWSMVKMQIEMATQKHDREMSARRQEIDAAFRKMQADIEDRYQQRKLKLDVSMARMGMMERLVTQGLSTGQADASVLNTMLKQATEQEYATTSDEKVKARAEAADKDLDTYRTAQAEERKHQQEMTGLAANLMGAAKQSPPTVIVPGTSTFASQTSSSEVGKTTCPSCQKSIQSGMNFCPFCGKPLSNAVT